jgi:hypothetical protein
VGQHDDLVGGQLVATEHRHRRGHAHPLAGAEVGQRAPAGGREERVAGGGADLAARRRAHPVDRLTAVVDVGARLGGGDRVAVEREHRHRRPARPGPVNLGGRADLAGGGVDDRRVPGHALAHRRPAADHHEGAGLEAGQQVVEVDVAGGHAGDGVAPPVELLEPVEVEAEQVLDLGRAVGDPALVDVVDHRLGPVECLGHVFRHAVADLGDLAGHADEPAQQGVLLDDAGVAGGVGGGRGGGHDVDQHLVAAHRVEQAVAPQLVGHRDRVDWLAAGVEGVDGVEDVGVGRLVEVVGPQDAGGDGDRLGLEHHGAEQRLFSLEVVGRDASTPGGAGRLRRGGHVGDHGDVHPRSPGLGNVRGTYPWMRCGRPADSWG